MTVKEMKAAPVGTTIGQVTLLVTSVKTKVAKNDSDYLMATLRDSTGEFTANVFGSTTGYAVLASASNGAVIITCSVKVEHYNGKFSPKLNNIALGTGVITSFMGGSPTHGRDILHLKGALARLSSPYHTLVETCIQSLGGWDAFYKSPAATGMHHAYPGGLLEHTSHMCEIAHRTAFLYPEVDVDIATTAIILHDCCKILEYKQDGSKGKTRIGVSHGHITLSAMLVNRYGQGLLNDAVREHIEHCILAHHGELEYGSPVFPATPTAVFVSQIDNLDAKMGMAAQAERDMPDDADIGEKNLGLSTNIIKFHAK